MREGGAPGGVPGASRKTSRAEVPGGDPGVPGPAGSQMLAGTTFELDLRQKK